MVRDEIASNHRSVNFGRIHCYLPSACEAVLAACLPGSNGNQNGNGQNKNANDSRRNGKPMPPESEAIPIVLSLLRRGEDCLLGGLFIRRAVTDFFLRAGLRPELAPHPGQRLVPLVGRTVITVAAPSQTALSTSNPRGTRADGRMARCMMLIPL
jgi:hypothetical protein